MSKNKHTNGRSRYEHDEEPNTGMRVGGDGNKIHGDDLDEIIPGGSERGADTFDMEGERITRVGSQDTDDENDDEDVDGGGRRGAETFDIEGEKSPQK